MKLKVNTGVRKQSDKTSTKKADQAQLFRECLKEIEGFWKL
jgi:hypothetical protein